MLHLTEATASTQPTERCKYLPGVMSLWNAGRFRVLVATDAAVGHPVVAVEVDVGLRSVDDHRDAAAVHVAVVGALAFEKSFFNWGPPNLLLPASHSLSAQSWRWWSGLAGERFHERSLRSTGCRLRPLLPLLLLTKFPLLLDRNLFFFLLADFEIVWQMLFRFSWSRFELKIGDFFEGEKWMADKNVSSSSLSSFENKQHKFVFYHIGGRTRTRVSVQFFFSRAVVGAS